MTAKTNASSFTTDNRAGVSILSTQDTEWAAKTLEQAFYTDQLRRFCAASLRATPSSAATLLLVVGELSAINAAFAAAEEQAAAELVCHRQCQVEVLSPAQR
jgi:hypothetical protein